MKMFCISDNIDTAVGLKMAGIEYEIITEKEKILSKIEEILKNKEIGILGVTEKIYELAEDEFKKIEHNNNIPLIVKIPNSN